MTSIIQPRADRFRKRTYNDGGDRRKEDPLRSLEQTIFNLGNPHPTLSLIEDIQQTAELLRRETTLLPELVPVLVACILELPHKLSQYVELLVLLHPEGGEFVRNVVESIASQFPSFATHGPWRHFVQAVRFCAMATQHGILEADSFVGLVQVLLGCTGTGKPETDFILWTVCAALPLVSITSADGILMTAFEQRSQEGLRLPKDLAGVWHCMKQTPRINALPVRELVTPITIQFGNLTSVVVDEAWDGDFEPLQLFPDAFQCDIYEQWTVYLWCRILIESMELNHRRCAEMLLNGIPVTYGSSDKIVSQFLFGELIRNRSNRIPAIVFETLLMDCCRLMRTFAPSMARGLYSLYDRMDDLGFVATDRLASWFSHHLSNFDLKWNWTTWGSVLTTPPTSMQYCFVRFTLEKLMRLSYLDRVTSTIPEEFKVLLPTDPLPSYKFSEGDDDTTEMASKVSELVQGRQSIDDIRASLGSFTEEEGLDATQKEVLLQSLLHVGSKSLSHMLAIVERYLSLFQLLILPKQADKTPSNFFILDQIASFWRNSMINFEFVVERLINYRILLPRLVIQWVMERADEQLSDVNSSFYEVVTHVLGRTLILRTLHQSYMMPMVAAGKMRGQEEERIASTVANLQAEFEDTLSFSLEKLSSLKDQVVSSDDILQSIDGFSTAMVKEIISTYPKECGKLAKSILTSTGRKMSPPVKAALEDAHLRI